MVEDPRKQRLVRNERIIRDKNRRAKKAIKTYFQNEEEIMVTPLSCTCECSNLDCTKEVMVSIGDYDEIHKRDDHFIVYKGHEIPDIERVVSETEAFYVVEKF